MSEDLEQKRRRVLRAREAIEGAGWAFDAYVRKLTGQWINEDCENRREALHHRVRAALELKADLAAIINQADNDEVLREHREHHRD
ncbi:hypothetical protein [Reyranella sp.]|uniref:hypothetical protein n=1 Tax=Reyranella sp. TaxID=1929291 RepID=UPI002F93E345